MSNFKIDNKPPGAKSRTYGSRISSHLMWRLCCSYAIKEKDAMKIAIQLALACDKYCQIFGNGLLPGITRGFWKVGWMTISQRQYAEFDYVINISCDVSSPSVLVPYWQTSRKQVSWILLHWLAEVIKGEVVNSSMASIEGISSMATST